MEWDLDTAKDIKGDGKEITTVELVAPTDVLAAEAHRSFVDMVFSLCISLSLISLLMQTRALLNVDVDKKIVGGGGCVSFEMYSRLNKIPTDDPLVCISF